MLSWWPRPSHSCLLPCPRQFWWKPSACQRVPVEDWWKDIVAVCSLEGTFTQPGSATWLTLSSVRGRVGGVIAMSSVRGIVDGVIAMSAVRGRVGGVTAMLSVTLSSVRGRVGGVIAMSSVRGIVDGVIAMSAVRGRVGGVTAMLSVTLSSVRGIVGDVIAMSSVRGIVDGVIAMSSVRGIVGGVIAMLNQVSLNTTKVTQQQCCVSFGVTCQWPDVPCGPLVVWLWCRTNLRCARYMDDGASSAGTLLQKLGQQRKTHKTHTQKHGFSWFDFSGKLCKQHLSKFLVYLMNIFCWASNFLWGCILWYQFYWPWPNFKVTGVISEQASQNTICQ